MATTGIWKVEKRLDHVLNYVMNIDKTKKINNAASYHELHFFKEYEQLDYNTEESCFVSGINCLPHRAYKDMMSTKNQYEKTNGILGYHAFQSFKEGEITPNKAHLIGLRLAQEVWGDRFEVIVATHQNSHCIHNHFVINSVSFKDGKKYHDCNETYAELRHLSDSLCYEHGLSVLDKSRCKKGKVDYENYYKNYIKKSNYHTIAKEDIDRAIAMAYSYKDFENILIKMGYEIKTRYRKLSIRINPYKKNIRIERSFGSDYSIESIEKRIENTFAPRVPFIEAYNPNNRVRSYEEHKKDKAHGIYGLYKYYCYLLRVYPRRNPRKVLSPALRVELNRMNEISEQTKLLVSKKIETYEQLLFHKDSLNSDIRNLVAKKHNLWIKYKRVKKEDDRKKIRTEIDLINKLLVPKRKEAILYEGIDKKLNEVKENIKEYEKEEGKEKSKYEFK